MSDGTPAGTGQVAEAPAPMLVGARDGVAFYTSGAASPDNSATLLRTDGTAAGTSTVIDHLSRVAVFPLGVLLFQEASRGGEPLRFSDGTAAGTRVLVQATVQTQSSDPRWLVVLDGSLFFATVVTGVASRGLYEQRGGAPVPLVSSENITDLAVIGDRALYFMNTTLFVLDASGRQGALGTAPQYTDCGGRTAVAGDHYYASCEGQAPELWEVADVELRRYPGATFREVAMAGPHPVLASSDPGFGLATLQDGARVPLGDPAAIGRPTSLTSVAGSVFFLAEGGQALWTTDGTEAGTRLVSAVDTQMAPLAARPMAEIGGHLWFAARDAEHGSELWTSDGTAKGTHLLADLVPGPGSSSPFGFTVVGDRVYFWALEEDGDGPVPWVADLAGSSASPLARAHPLLGEQYGDRGIRIASFVPLTEGGPVLFTGVDVAHGAELWMSNGTPEGTQLVLDLVPGPDSSSPAEPTVVGDQVFFSAFQPGIGRELFALSRSALLGGPPTAGMGPGGAGPSQPSASGSPSSGGCATGAGGASCAAAILLAALLATRRRQARRQRGRP